MDSIKADILKHACAALESDGVPAVREILQKGYPFTPQPRAGRCYTKAQMLRVYLRDGFIDRYSGERLVFPGTLRLLSLLCPEEFPYHKNGKLDVCHIGWWELYPSIDHVIPVSRGGADNESNWVTTSMLRNSVKALWTLEELGWELHPPGNMEEWDGLTGWFCRFMKNQPSDRVDLNLPYLRDSKRVIDVEL